MVSGATSAAVMLSTLLATGWLAGGLGPVAFGVYALSRRLLSVISAISPGPLSVALARSHALATDDRERDEQFCSALLLALLPNLAIAAGALAFPAVWAELLLSAAAYADVLAATMALQLATTAYALVFSRLRGSSRVRAANLWQLWAMGVGPLIVAAALAPHGRVAPVVLGLAATSSLALVPLSAWTLRAVRAGTSWGGVRTRIRAQLRYVLPRIPAAAAFGALLSIGPLLAPYFGTLTEAGYLVAGQSVLRIVEAGTAGFGLVALPRMAALYAQQRPEYVRDRVEDLVGLVLHVGLFTAGQLAVWAPEIVRAWLGPDYAPAVPIIRVLLIALVPYLGYAMLRSVIDAIEVRAINAGNLYSGLAVAVTLSLGLGAAGFGAFGLALAGAAGLVVLGGRTVRFLQARLGFAGDHVALPLALALNLFTIATAVAVRALAVEHLEGAALATCSAGSVAATAGLYLIVLRRRNVRWLTEIERRLRGHGAAA